MVKIAPAHVLMHPHTHWHICMHDTHSLTHSPSLTHTHRLPPGYRDLIEFFSRYPGLVKWTGIPLLLYFNAGSLDVALTRTTFAPTTHPVTHPTPASIAPNNHSPFTCSLNPDHNRHDCVQPLNQPHLRVLVTAHRRHPQLSDDV